MSDNKTATHDPSVSVRRCHLPLLRKGRKVLMRAKLWGNHK